MNLSWDGIPFDILKLDEWLREPEYSEDKTTFLWWHHKITVDCVLNVDATAAFNFPRKIPIVEQPKKAPVGAPGVVANVGKVKPKEVKLEPASDTSGFGSDVFAASQEELDAARKAFSERIKDRYDRIFNQDVPENLRQNEDAFREAARQQREEDRARRAAAVGLAGGLGPAGAAAAGGAKKPKPPRKAGGGGGFVPSTVPATDVELRERLRRQRRQLLVWMNSGPNGAPEYLLASPMLPNFQSDAQHGPTCTLMAAKDLIGNVTGIYRLQFETWEAPGVTFATTGRLSTKGKAIVLRRATDPETLEAKAMDKALRAYIGAAKDGKPFPHLAASEVLEDARKDGIGGNEAIFLVQAALAALLGPALAAVVAGQIEAALEKRMVATPALLSHRWKMRFGVDPGTWMRTQIIEGEAVFRMDVLRSRGLTADQLRSQIWHPIPRGYKRDGIEADSVQISPGGDAVKYQIVDRQQMMNYPGGVQFGTSHVSAKTICKYHGYTLGGDASPPSGASMSTIPSPSGLAASAALRVNKEAGAVSNGASDIARSAAGAAKSSLPGG